MWLYGFVIGFVVLAFALSEPEDEMDEAIREWEKRQKKPPPAARTV